MNMTGDGFGSDDDNNSEDEDTEWERFLKELWYLLAMNMLYTFTI